MNPLLLLLALAVGAALGWVGVYYLTLLIIAYPRECLAVAVGIVGVWAVFSDNLERRA